MNGRFHNCEHCDGYLSLSYDGWSCSLCGRKYHLRAGRMAEMWWRNQIATEDGSSE